MWQAFVLNMLAGYLVLVDEGSLLNSGYMVGRVEVVRLVGVVEIVGMGNHVKDRVVWLMVEKYKV